MDKKLDAIKIYEIAESGNTADTRGGSCIDVNASNRIDLGVNID